MPATTDAPTCSVVIPCYHSETTVAPLFERLDQTFAQLALPYEVLFIDDASPDRVGAALDALRERAGDRVSVIHLSGNRGQHLALLAGLERARGEVIVTMDDDLQNPPEEIPKLLAALTPGIDVVYGHTDRRQHAWWRNLASLATNALMILMIGKPRRLKLASFRALRREFADTLLREHRPRPFLDAEIVRLTSRVATVTVRHDARVAGGSSYSLRALATLAARLIAYVPPSRWYLISALGAFVCAVTLGVMQRRPSYVTLVALVGGAGLLAGAFLARRTRRDG